MPAAQQIFCLVDMLTALVDMITARPYKEVDIPTVHAADPGPGRRICRLMNDREADTSSFDGYFFN